MADNPQPEEKKEPVITNPAVHEEQEKLKADALRKIAGQTTGKYDPNESEEDAIKDIERGNTV